MRHLIRLVTPIGGVILDPFAGSGSTGVAATLEGFDFILIEQSAEYVAIAEARLNGTQRGLGLDVGAPTRKQPTIGMHSLPPEKRAGHAVEGWGFTGQTDDDTPDPETGMSENDLRWPFGHAVQPDEEPAA